jgi:hypothetical protein
MALSWAISPCEGFARGVLSSETRYLTHVRPVRPFPGLNIPCQGFVPSMLGFIWALLRPYNGRPHQIGPYLGSAKACSGLTRH